MNSCGRQPALLPIVDLARIHVFDTDDAPDDLQR